MFAAHRKWQNSDTRSKKRETLITEMIATDNLPFAFVSGVGFQRLVAALEPRYKLKSEKHYRTKMLEGIVEKVEKKKIKAVISEEAGPFLSFTTDCWSGDTEALRSLTCHFIDPNWDRKQVLLNAKTMSGSHTGEYIGDMFISLLEYWDISHDRVVLVLNDSGANMVKGLRLGEIPDLSCSAHTLQLVVNDGINSQRVVLDINAKLKNFAKHFNHSVLAKQKLNKILQELGLPEHSILQSEPTRWNSTLHMMQRMVEQKRALNIYAREYGKITTLSPDQWDIVSNLIDTLEPMEEVTLEVSKSEASISCVIPSIAVLKMILQTEGPNTIGIKTLRDSMLQSLQRRFQKMEDPQCLVLATLLDPRYKGHVFSEGTLHKAKRWIKEEHAVVSEQLKMTTSAEERPHSKQRRVEVQEVPGPSSVIDQMYANILGPHGSLTQESDEDCLLSDQLQHYLREPVINRQTVPSERVFSEIGNIYDKKRSNIKGEHAEQLCFLHDNLRFLNWQY
ncbi:LOW QUALITY PROTEIN: zinc finger BED domain-containing protein 4-like [Alosa sapidissima]|uniref:LOW QUALITY PROTEIN: zinc finger BED domain-containing protein 4-like n=1 Tax=Alosa sapidissima TaxID=34773 RepID=UPI001C09F5C5|nr:LOW QUALITY PROTEIN: zinc finger BED domain-containing protein 4-like [Alosa sapidissima]